MRTTSRFLPVFAVAAIGLAACGGSDSDGSATSDVPEATTEVTEPIDEFTEDTVVEDTTAPEPTVPAAVATDAPVVTIAATTPSTAAPVVTESTVGETSAAGAAVTLDEWVVDAPAEYVAGEITFTVTNNGGFPHEFVVIQGESYASLPLSEGGGVLEDDLPTGALLGRTARIGGGGSEDLKVTLVPGNYVLLCNLGAGANSHAGQGQRLDITVT